MSIFQISDRFVALVYIEWEYSCDGRRLIRWSLQSRVEALIRNKTSPSGSIHLRNLRLTFFSINLSEPTKRSKYVKYIYARMDRGVRETLGSF